MLPREKPTTIILTMQCKKKGLVGEAAPASRRAATVVCGAGYNEAKRASRVWGGVGGCQFPRRPASDRLALALWQLGLWLAAWPPLKLSKKRCLNIWWCFAAP